MYVLRFNTRGSWNPQYFAEDSGGVDRNIANNLEDASKYDTVGELVKAVVEAQVQNFKEDHPKVGLHDIHVIEVQENTVYEEVGEVA